MKKTTSIIVLIFLTLSITAQNLKKPSFEEIISLNVVRNVVLSPNGKHVVFSKGATDWKENRFDSELWISKNGEEPFQLTNSKKSSSTAKWSPDGKWIAFVSDKGSGSQIYAIKVVGGEAIQVTNSKKGIYNFEWSPDGNKIAYLQSEDNSKENKKVKDKFGSFKVEDKEFNQSQIWITNFNPDLLMNNPLPNTLKDSVYKSNLEAKLLIGDKAFSITNFKWSPNGKKIAFTHQPNSLINSAFKADISIYDISSKKHKVLVDNKSYDGLIDWSPDSKSILYTSNLNNVTSNYYTNENVFSINIDGTNTKQLAKDFDENLSDFQWNKNGIYALTWLKTKRVIVHVNPNTGIHKVLPVKHSKIWSYSFSKDAKKVVYAGRNNDHLSEIYTTDSTFSNPVKLTKSSEQIKDWAVATSEVISWKSKDGEIIEGVLNKPMNYDPKKKYPLLVIIHGGPTGVSIPGPTASYVYPMVQWVNKGALILRPNYRGSAGYGERFRSLNVKNLGVGDAWDVMSGIKHLDKKGMIDTDKLGVMGWSQGGYISAFLTTNTKEFKAVSVGAGISNWMTYYVNTDIHPFTRQYLKATPWSDKEIYEKTSPMTTINKAVTPTLIQHGEFDNRVPIANANELYQGLKDKGVATRYIVYKGFGHAITKPKEQLAATWHNWQWFLKYIWNEEVELPKE
ncbi:S9 family peptidase [Tenacibaculum jejuense]|uniref:Peptidase S9 family n=1 Tax=Tenacibaculum jejuense TaxID=584609 RepID=A0A238UA74_9FLAO|nr:S9 family peptidase [Tenacibaculum jejuense]SNR15975.1 Peptidase S9 family precursor [Tenacibaculum jejuense]